jgi:hypothetical protein
MIIVFGIGNLFNEIAFRSKIMRYCMTIEVLFYDEILKTL